jgi:SAM-dependent methyltransferase
MNFWDQQYSSPDFKYGKQANQFLRNQAVRLLPKSRVLLPGDGEGRNSVWLAEKGHQVTALDNSRVGLDKALTLALERGVGIEVIEADLGDWTPEDASYDALVLTYVHLPASVRMGAHGRLIQALRPGGWFILEAFHPLQLGMTSGGPKAEDMLYTADMIRSDMSQNTQVVMKEIFAWEGQTQLLEGSGHQGPAQLTRYVAQRE